MGSLGCAVAQDRLIRRVFVERVRLMLEVQLQKGTTRKSGSNEGVWFNKVGREFKKAR